MPAAVVKLPLRWVSGACRHHPAILANTGCAAPAPLPWRSNGLTFKQFSVQRTAFYINQVGAAFRLLQALRVRSVYHPGFANLTLFTLLGPSIGFLDLA